MTRDYGKCGEAMASTLAFTTRRRHIRMNLAGSAFVLCLSVILMLKERYAIYVLP